MKVFKPNLTSDLIKKEAQKILSKRKKEVKILEIGCGNGNITKHLIENQKKIKHKFFLSDISLSAVNAARKNIGNIQNPRFMTTTITDKKLTELNQISLIGLLSAMCLLQLFLAF